MSSNISWYCLAGCASFAFVDFLMLAASHLGAFDSSPYGTGVAVVSSLLVPLLFRSADIDLSNVGIVASNDGHPLGDDVLAQKATPTLKRTEGSIAINRSF